MQILDGKTVAAHVKKQIAESVSTLLTKGSPRPGLAVILVGDDPASQVYVGSKIKTCEELGFASFEYRLPLLTDFLTLQKKIHQLNQDPQVHGILVQLPLPAHLDEAKVIDQISPAKDVDCLTATNMGRLLQGQQKISACTPSGVMELLKFYNLNVAGKRAVVVGRSRIVGLPMAQLLIQANATVTVAHSKTQNLRELTRSADLVVAALGKPQFLTADDFKSGAIIVDVGIHRLADKKLCGDVKRDGIEAVAAALTPVPGGVGPMTIAMLMKNTWELYKLLQGVQ